MYKSTRIVPNLEGFEITETNEFIIEPTLVAHNVPNRCFKITEKETKQSLLYLTDSSDLRLSEKHQPYENFFKNLTYYLVESNYSEELFDLGLEFIYGNPKFQRYDILASALRHTSKEDFQKFIDRNKGPKTKVIEELHQSERFYDLTIRDPRETKHVLQDYDYSKEIWKEIDFLENNTRNSYIASNLGRIASFSATLRKSKNIKISFKILKPKIDKYASINLGGNNRDKLIHRLIAFKFCNIDKLTWKEFNKQRHKNTNNKKWNVHHKNKNTFDNRAENLEILTTQEHLEKHKERKNDER
jgi:hypothetical protein